MSPTTFASRGLGDVPCNVNDSVYAPGAVVPPRYFQAMMGTLTIGGEECANIMARFNHLQAGEAGHALRR